MNEDDARVEIDLSINNLRLIYDEEIDNNYKLKVDGDINGDFSIKITGVPRINGGLTNTVLNGHLIFDNNLSIINGTLNIDGTLKVSFVPITIDIDLNIDCNPQIMLIDFPLNIGKEWITSPSTVNVFGVVRLPGLKNIPGVPDDVPDEFPIEQTAYSEGSEASCTNIENITIGDIGKYESYQIEYVNKTLYYSPVLGNIVKIETPSNQYIRVTFLLRSTTYTVPGAPNIPTRPTGINNGKPGDMFEYSTNTTDNENDDIYYLFDWDDGSNSGWLGPYPSGENVNTNHTWSKKGSYSVRVKAKDTKDHESRWSKPLQVSMPKLKQNTILESILDNLFIRYPIFKQVYFYFNLFFNKISL
jgi:hypothetical protein